MTGRLFGKILLGFWIAYLAASFGALPMFTLLRHYPSSSEEQVGQRMAPAVLALCREAIERAGPAACRKALTKLDPKDRDRLQLWRADAPGAHGPAPLAVIPAPDGHRYALSYTAVSEGLWPRLIFRVPLEVVLLGFLASLAFSAALVWYVVAPLRRIRQGFDALSAGKLSARVADKIGRRRDEIADLARDFDHMAGQVEQIVAARERLLHDVSHELRSPIGRLQLAIALARQDGSRLPASLDRIEAESMRLNTMVDELLTLARAEAGIGLDEEYSDLAGILEYVVADAAFEARSRNIAVDLAIDSPVRDMPPLSGNSKLIRRAIENVVRNAVKFSSEGHRIDVGCWFDAPGRCFQIEVRDQGPGVPQALLNQLFEPFVTGGAVSAGFGLGLSIAQRAVRAHNGDISARNLTGGGLGVTITLPLRAPVSDAAARPQAATITDFIPSTARLGQ